MLPGNDHQVHGAGVLQHLPVLARQPGTIPHYQCGQPSAPAMGLYRQQALAQTVAPGALGRRQQLAILDRTDGADTPSQQPRLVVEPLDVE